jgi:hypothetical protein
MSEAFAPGLQAPELAHPPAPPAEAPAPSVTGSMPPEALAAAVPLRGVPVARGAGGYTTKSGGGSGGGAPPAKKQKSHGTGERRIKKSKTSALAATTMAPKPRVVSDVELVQSALGKPRSFRPQILNP